MRVYFVVPTIDTNTNCELQREMSAEDYSRMVEEEFRKTNAAMNSFMESWGQNSYSFLNNTGLQVQQKQPDKYVFYSVEADIFSGNGSEINAQTLSQYVQNKKKFILTVRPDYSKGDAEAEEELKYWLHDSLLVANDPTTDDRTKLFSFPEKQFLIDTGETVFHIEGCKAVDVANNLSDFCLMIGRIEYNN